MNVHIELDVVDMPDDSTDLELMGEAIQQALQERFKRVVSISSIGSYD